MQYVATRMCYRCNVERPMDDFVHRIDDRYYRMCKDCVSVVLKRSGSLQKRERLSHTTTHRTCYLCRRVLPVESFTRRSNGTYFSACKECNRHVFGQRRRARLLNSSHDGLPIAPRGRRCGFHRGFGIGATGSYTTAEWSEILAGYDACPRCRRRWDKIPPPPSRSAVITVDHIIALANGGSNDITNLQPMCYSCNSKKGTKFE